MRLTPVICERVNGLINKFPHKFESLGIRDQISSAAAHGTPTITMSNLLEVICAVVWLEFLLLTMSAQRQASSARFYRRIQHKRQDERPRITI